MPAFAAELPEADHNEIVGWESAAAFAPFAAVFLEDPGAGERLAARVELTAEIVGGQARGGRARRAARRDAHCERLLSHVLLGDLVSLYARRAARGRPDRHRADRPAQGRACRALSPRRAGRRRGPRPGLARDLAARCAELGSLAVVERRARRPGLETLAHFAAAAPELDLGVGVLPLHRHPPAAIAAAVERLGLDPARLWLGIGSGSLRPQIEPLRRAVAELRDCSRTGRGS